MPLKKRIRVLIIIGAALVVVVVGPCLVLVWLSRALVYIPSPYNAVEAAAILQKDPAVTEASLETDGIRLHGYVVRNADGPKAPWTVFFVGQGSAAVRFAPVLRRVPGCNFAVFDYRGYGLSGGEPSEQKLMEDAIAIYDHVKKNLAGPGAPVYAMGYSLGTGLAVNLAARRPVSGLVLAAPYDTLRRVAADRFPEFILSIFLHEDYDSLSRIGAVRCPLLVFATSDDRIVPFRHTQALFERANEPKTLVMVPGATHQTLVPSEQCREGMAGFFIRQGGRHR